MVYLDYHLKLNEYFLSKKKGINAQVIKDIMEKIHIVGKNALITVNLPDYKRRGRIGRNAVLRNPSVWVYITSANF